jgi:acyl dehydratase
MSAKMASSIATPNEFLKTIGQARLYWEDMEIGFGYKTPSRSITEADTVIFAGLSTDYNQIHVDAEFGKRGPFGQRIAHGLLVVSIMSGLNTRALAYRIMTPTMILLRELRSRFLKPIFIGDTLCRAMTSRRCANAIQAVPQSRLQWSSALCRNSVTA